MGKGDKKTKRGKIVIGTYGVRRTRKKTHLSNPLKEAEKKTKQAPVLEETVGTKKKTARKAVTAEEKRAKEAKKTTTSKKKKEDTLE